MNHTFEDIEAIKRVKYDYCNGIDTCDLDLLRSIMTEDFSVDYLGGTYRFKSEGRDNVLDIMKQAFHPEFVSCHTVTMPYIDLTSETTAAGRWRLLDYAMNLAKENETTIGASTYRDTYQKGDDGKWRLQSSAYERLYERVFKEENPALTHFALGGGHVGNVPTGW